jgi:type I restriction enzyme S subunit
MGQDVCLLKKKASGYSSAYLQAVIRSPIILSQLEDLMVGSTFKRVNVEQIKNLQVPMPSAKEQRAIAEVLSDVDELIAALDRLIAKKRAIKQGAMQQLLTGKTRLPGFSGSWDIKRLDNVAEIYNGGTPSTNQSEFWDGDVVWCTPTDVTALDGFKYLSRTARTITALGLKASSAELIPAHSIVMTSRATIGECAINTVPVATNQGFKSLVPFQDADVEFLYYLLQTKKRDFLSMCSGSTFPEISKSQVAAFEIELPAKKTEQSAIAAVLSDMDAEIAALEARRDKTRALKQGMMQELLTGRTRLV